MNFLTLLLCSILLISFVSGSDSINESAETPLSTVRSELAPNSNAVVFEVDLPLNAATLTQYRSSYMVLALFFAIRTLQNYPLSNINIIFSSIFSAFAIYFIYIYVGITVDIIHNAPRNLYRIILCAQNYPEADKIIPFEIWTYSLVPFIYGINAQGYDKSLSEFNRGIMTLTAISIILAIEILHRIRMRDN